MNAEERLTTDELIGGINKFPKVYAVRNRTYGVCVYQDYESYQKDKTSWFMTIDPKATSIAQPFGCNFERWPEDWSDSDYWNMSSDYWNMSVDEAFDMADYLQDMIADLIDRYIATPVFRRDETILSSVTKEALLHQLKGTINNKNLSTEAREACLKYAHGVFNTLCLERDYEATVKPEWGVEIVFPD